MALYLGKDKIAGIGVPQPTENNSLKLPEVAPGVQQIVSVNADGTQQNLTFGSGIVIQDGVINIADDTSVKRYQHNINIVYAGDSGYGNPANVSLTIISDTNVAYNYSTLCSYLMNIGTTSSKPYPASGGKGYNYGYEYCSSVYASSNRIYIAGLDITTNASNKITCSKIMGSYLSTSSTVTDLVIEL